MSDVGTIVTVHAKVWIRLLKVSPDCPEVQFRV